MYIYILKDNVYWYVFLDLLSGIFFKKIMCKFIVGCFIDECVVFFGIFDDVIFLWIICNVCFKLFFV